MGSVLASFLLVFAAASRAAEPWPGSWKFRRTVQVAARTEMGKRDVAVTTFFTGGQVRPKARDVAVYGGGKRLRSRVLAVGPGDVCRVAFEVSPAVKTYHVYYGSATATSSQDWRPPFGLLLETRNYNGGDPTGLAAMRTIVRQSGPSFGADFVSHIFQGYNLFGPNEHFVSIYRGKLWIERAGEYRFATSSDDASFLLIDGTVAAAKPGWGGAVARPKFAGRRRYLSKGPHSVTYLHVQGRDRAIAAAYWRRPGDKHFGLIPPGAFPAPLRVTASAVQRRGSAIAADMTLLKQGLLWHDDALMGRLVLKDRSRLPDGAKAQYLWDFGDGVTSAEQDPEHVYLHSGEVAVTLTVTLGARELTTRQRFLVGPGWPCQLTQQEMNKAKYAAVAGSYEPERLALRDMLAGIDLFEDVGRGRDILRWSRTLFLSDKRQQLSQQQWMRYGRLYGRLLRDSGSAEASVQLFTLCLSTVKGSVNRAQLLAERGDSKLLDLRQPDAAAEDYLAALKLRGNAKHDVFRLAQVRLGDVERQKGRLDAARAEYAKAVSMRAPQAGLQSAVKLGAYQQSIDNYLLRNQLDTAQSLLDTWEWERPQDKLVGLTTLLRARLQMKRKSYQQAIGLAKDLLHVNPASERAPQLLLLQSDAWLALEQSDKASAALQRLLKDYPEAAEQQDARRKLKALGEAAEND